MKNLIIVFLFLLLFNVNAYCEQSKISLTDGSVINGEIAAYADGIYTINTAVFGEIKLEGKKVAKIESFGQSGDPVSAQVSAYSQTLMKNPENAAIVTGLTKNSQLQEMAGDPELQEAAKSGDIQALLKNPKFMEIVNSQEVQDAVKKIKQ